MPGDTLALGRCFQWAFAEYARRRAAGDAVALVHARVTAPGGTRAFDHAWVEDAERAYDWQTMVAGASRFAREGWPLALFHETWAPSGIRRYTEAVGPLRQANGHCGPWDDAPEPAQTSLAP